MKKIFISPYIKNHIVVFFLFVLLTAVMTYPIAFKMNNCTPNGKDHLSVIWILKWNTHQLFSDPLHLFDSNIFYPNKLTHSYQEIAIGIVPYFYIFDSFTKNPVFAYNILWFLSFVLTGFGMYLLVTYLTNNRYAGIISGIILSFSPHRFFQYQLTDIFILWFPLSFLALHRLIKKCSQKISIFYGELLLFSFCFISQVLSSWYIGLFLSVSIGVYVVYYIFISDVRKICSIILNLFLAGIICSLFIFPFAYPYFKLSKIMGFVRPIWEVNFCSATIFSYFSVLEQNKLYGKLFSESLWRPSGVAFPGVLAISFAIGEIFRFKNIGYSTHSESIINILWVKRLRYLIDILLILMLTILIFSLLIGNISFNIYDKTISIDTISDIVILTFIVLILFFLRFLFKKIVHCFFKIFCFTSNESVGYFIIGIVAFLLSLGSNIDLIGNKIGLEPDISDNLTQINLYWLFYNLIPSFKGFRGTYRWEIVVIFSIAVIAGFGVKKLLDSIEGERFKKFFIVILPLIVLIILIEYFSAPISFHRIPVKEEVPYIYKWLSNQSDSAIIEFPFKNPEYYVYFSIYHFKKLVNGYGGFTPPSTRLVQNVIKEFPSEESIKLLKKIKVDYIIIHSDSFSVDVWENIKESMNTYIKDAVLFNKFGSDYVYKLNYLDESFIYSPFNKGNKQSENLKPFNKNLYYITSNDNESNVVYANDNNLNTYWRTTGEVENPYLQINFNKPYKISKLSFKLKNLIGGYPYKYKVESSLDGNNWKLISEGFGSVSHINSLVDKPLDSEVEIYIGEEVMQFIKITEIERKEDKKWCVFEVVVYSYL